MNTSGRTRARRGAMAEECLGKYFRSLGSYVLRGVPVREGSEHVTDIDLWVYTRPTAHSRHIAIVDIKNRRRGKAFERAIWVKGLQSALGADEAIVASRGVKDAAHRFSERLTIRVISSSIFDAIIKRYDNYDERLATEELDDIWKKILIDKVSLKARVERVKSEISRGIDFRALNVWLDEGAKLLKLATEREQVAGPVTRAAYLCCSLIAIGADYLGKHHSLSDTSIRRDFFRQGMLFGRTDSEDTQTYLDFVENMVNEYLDVSGSASAQIRSGFERSIEKLPIQGLVEFFSQPHSSSELLKGAVALEDACYARNALCPRELGSLEAKMIIGLISDYAGLVRRDVLGTREETRVERNLDNSDKDKQGELLEGQDVRVGDGSSTVSE